MSTNIPFAFTEEQDQFRDMVQRFLSQKSPTTEVRRLMATNAGFDREVWRQLSQELALPAIHIPEVYGGAGFGTVELGIVMEELGRHLLCAPYLSTCVLAANAILNVGTEAQKTELLPGIAAGQTLAALAVTEASGRWDPDAVATRAAETVGGYLIDGTKTFVVDGHTADLLVVVAREESGALQFFLVDPNQPGVNRRLLDSMDATRKIAEIRFTNATAARLGETNDATEVLARTLDQAAIALANEMVGGAQALLDSAVAYANMRVQFGRTIGSFQAIKHKCADMLLDVELARSAAYYAAQADAAGDPETPALACLAKACASDAYLRTAAQTIQIHGGIGFTWENDTHLWFKRAKSSEVFLGTPAYHRELLMQRWGV